MPIPVLLIGPVSLAWLDFRQLPDHLLLYQLPDDMLLCQRCASLPWPLPSQLPDHSYLVAPNMSSAEQLEKAMLHVASVVPLMGGR